MKKKIFIILIGCLLFCGGLGIGFAEGKNDFSSTSFELDVNGLSPSTNSWNKGTSGNFSKMLKYIGTTLLIATSTLAVLSIVIGGVIISTTGTSDRAAKGKTIIKLNIMAIFIALFSYSIIQLVKWIISV